MNVHVRSKMLDYGLALVITILATWLRHLIQPYVGERLAFVTYFPAVFITAIFTRLGPCVLTVGLSTVAVAHYFIPPTNSLLPEDTAGWTGLALFAFFGVGVGLLSERVRQSERQLRRSEEELADFFENAAMGLHWVGPDGTIMRVNRAELDMLGYTREEYVGHHIAEFHADQPVIEDILHCLASGQQLRDYEARLRCKDGTIKHV
ncbi:MAG: DUF4118 domain-containing protein, partial [Planctomycetota bacterium]